MTVSPSIQSRVSNKTTADQLKGRDKGIYRLFRHVLTIYPSKSDLSWRVTTGPYRRIPVYGTLSGSLHRAIDVSNVHTGFSHQRRRLDFGKAITNTAPQVLLVSAKHTTAKCVHQQHILSSSSERAIVAAEQISETRDQRRCRKYAYRVQ